MLTSLGSGPTGEWDEDPACSVHLTGRVVVRTVQAGEQEGQQEVGG